MTAHQNEPSVDQLATAADELRAAELDAANGGFGRMFELYSKISKMHHEMLKSIISNFPR